MINWKFHALGVTGKVCFVYEWLLLVFVLAKLMVNPAG